MGHLPASASFCYTSFNNVVIISIFLSNGSLLCVIINKVITMQITSFSIFAVAAVVLVIFFFFSFKISKLDLLIIFLILSIQQYLIFGKQFVVVDFPKSFSQTEKHSTEKYSNSFTVRDRTIPYLIASGFKFSFVVF